MGYQIHTPCLPETSFCDGSAGCGSDTEMVAIARIMPVFTGKPWDAETSYGALEVVEEPDGTMYVTKVPTPAGTELTECKFWAVYNKNMWTHLEEEAEQRREADIALGERIDEEAQARAAADDALGEQLTQETAQRIAADKTLQSAIDEEEEGRLADAAKLTQELADETTARKNADTELEQALTEEIDNVKNDLQGKIDAVPAVTKSYVDDLISHVPQGVILHKVLPADDAFSIDDINSLITADYNGTFLGGWIYISIGVVPLNIVAAVAETESFAIHSNVINSSAERDFNITRIHRTWSADDLSATVLAYKDRIEWDANGDVTITQTWKGDYGVNGIIWLELTEGIQNE